MVQVLAPQKPPISEASWALASHLLNEALTFNCSTVRQCHTAFGFYF